MRYLAALLFVLLGLVEFVLRVALFILLVLGTLFLVLLSTDGVHWQFEPECFEFARQCLDAAELPPRTKTERNVYD